MEHPMKIDDLGVPLFQETSTSANGSVSIAINWTTLALKPRLCMRCSGAAICCDVHLGCLAMDTCMESLYSHYDLMMPIHVYLIIDV